jgi:putative flippase GtrA
MTHWRTFGRFNVVGGLGVAVQLGTLAGLTSGAGVHYLTATVVSLTVTLVHNFIWHCRWTWPDRAGGPAVAIAFARFVLANGVVPGAGNLATMAVLTGGLQVPPVAANVVAIALSGLLNYQLADRVVFVRDGGHAARTSAPTMSRRWRTPCSLRGPARVRLRARRPR